MAAKPIQISVTATLQRDGMWHVAVSTPPKGHDVVSLVDGCVLVMANLVEACDQMVAACVEDSTREERVRQIMAKLSEQVAAGVVESESKVRRVE